MTSLHLKIGQSAKIGMTLQLSSRGTLIPYRGKKAHPIGVAATYLKRGHIAKCLEGGRWVQTGIVDPELTAVSNGFFGPNTFVGEAGTTLMRGDFVVIHPDGKLYPVKK